jgi:NADH dehydrogenase/putative oxidoreductase
VPGLTGVYVIGDAASVDAWNGQPVPGLAPAAKQSGAFVAHKIRAHLEGQPGEATFRYQHLGSMATIGRKAAVVDFGGLRVSGAMACWLWGAVHVAFLANIRSRISVSMDWFCAYLTFRANTRLITGTDGAPVPDQER